MLFQSFNRLSENYIESLNDNEYYDTTIEVGKDPNVKIFRAHMVILCYRSPFLRRTLTSNKKNNDNILAHIKLSNIQPETFQIILEYIYGGIILFDEQETLGFLEVLDAANQLRLQELIDYLQRYLIENKVQWMEQNFGLVYQTNFKMIKNTLLSCLPLIRFFSLSSEEFAEKVRPYKKLLEHRLYEVLLNSYLDPKIEPIKGTEEIIEGYNPLVWKSLNDEYGETKDCFIFSFKSKSNFKDLILSHVNHGYISEALFYHTNCGPNCGRDLYMCAKGDDLKESSTDDSDDEMEITESGVRNNEYTMKISLPSQFREMNFVSRVINRRKAKECRELKKDNVGPQKSRDHKRK
ncbi:BTB/POZ protein [Rhizophagus clarus]|uniref:BTB/POZ protein n=1 Tax=Rhizophagus clarus TaxID=94130 RepID=A0A8H3MAY4_9GLOM|nr:BTB/POZ protein [Rhizophagus clarus]